MVGKSQKASVEEFTYGIQTGLFGLWLYHEAKLSDQITFRSEIGYAGGLAVSFFYDSPIFFMAPDLSIEPRWYYNLDRRVSKSKTIRGNSGSFLSVNMHYFPDKFSFVSDEYVDFISQLVIVPSWGINRKIGDFFTFEFKAGVGYRHYFSENTSYGKGYNDVVVYSCLRVGWMF